MSKDVIFCILDKDIAAIQDKTTLIQRCILSMALHFPEGMTYDNIAIGKIFQVKPNRISHLITDLERKRFITQDNKQSRGRIIWLNPEHPTLKKLAEEHKNRPELHCEKTQSKKASVGEKSQSEKCLHCYFEHSTLCKITKSYKEVRNISKEREKMPVGNDKKLSIGTDVQTTQAFEKFWQTYPRKEKRIEAQRLWNELNPGNELIERILSNIQRRNQTFDWLKDNGRFIPLPTTYLEGQRWLDELPEPKRGDPDWLPTEEEADKVLREAGIS